MSKTQVIFVTASRLSREQFSTSPIFQSLTRMQFDGAIGVHMACDNGTGLPIIYNSAITETYRDSILVFVHDDLWIDDVFAPHHIRAALMECDVIGLAGNTRLVPGASAWHVKNDNMDVDTGNLTGVVCHGAQPFGTPAIFGPTPASAQLLDGVLLAAKCSVLLDAGVRFDERFNFHFYDIDFSRQANAVGLRVSTWPLAVTHVSGGGFGSAEWKRNLLLYREKWGENK